MESFENLQFFSLLFCCSNIVLFSVRIFRNSVFGQVFFFFFFRYFAIELVSERCIVNRLEALHIRKKQLKLKRINFEFSTNVLKCF